MVQVFASGPSLQQKSQVQCFREEKKYLPRKSLRYSRDIVTADFVYNVGPLYNENLWL